MGVFSCRPRAWLQLPRTSGKPGRWSRALRGGCGGQGRRRGSVCCGSP